MGTSVPPTGIGASLIRNTFAFVSVSTVSLSIFTSTVIWLVVVLAIDMPMIVVSVDAGQV